MEIDNNIPNIEKTCGDKPITNEEEATHAPNMITELKGHNEEGTYWNISHTVHTVMINAMAAYNSMLTSYNNISALLYTPQYGSNRGLKEFGIEGYNTARKELNKNLLGMDAVEILDVSVV